MRKKGWLFLLSVTALGLFCMISLPRSSHGITAQEVSGETPRSATSANLNVERIIVKEIGDNYITSSDGRMIRFGTTTNVYKKLGDGSKMVIAELHYVDGRLAAIYIFR